LIFGLKLNPREKFLSRKKTSFKEIWNFFWKKVFSQFFIFTTLEKKREEIFKILMNKSFLKMASSDESQGEKGIIIL